MYKKILILVEGQTEESFVKLTLNDYLKSQGVFIVPIIIKTKEMKSGPSYKGGGSSYTKIKRDLLKLLKDSSATLVTTMIDYYGLPGDFPKFSQSGNCYTRVGAAENAFASDIKNDNFFPYLQLHEFESLLFAIPEILANTIDVSGGHVSDFEEIRNSFSSPEEINEGLETHPYKRIKKIFPCYNKAFYGQLISSRIGIEQLLSNCPHFKQWIDRLIRI